MLSVQCYLTLQPSKRFRSHFFLFLLSAIKNYSDFILSCFYNDQSNLSSAFNPHCFTINIGIVVRNDALFGAFDINVVTSTDFMQTYICDLDLNSVNWINEFKKYISISVIKKIYNDVRQVFQQRRKSS